jgi:phospholipid/cholesterol/gamma-HCH transport system ATP-binding protein
MISVQNVHKSFGDQDVLKGISADFEAGQCNLIIGRSGSGKTVLIKCMVGLLTPEIGHIYYDGKDITVMNEDQRKEQRRELGMLFQGNALFDSMTVEQNIKFPLDMFTKMTEAEKRDRVNFWLEKVNLPRSTAQFPAW